jgi:hypothetical protein
MTLIMTLKNMHFFPILASTCGGTEGFTMLAKNARAAKAMLHLGALTFFASLLIVSCGWFRLDSKVDRIITFLQERLGGIEIVKSGIRPVNEPEKAKYYLVTPDLEFNYTPKAKVTAKDLGQSNNVNKGIIWSPGIVAMWLRSGKDQYTYMPFIWAPSKIAFPEIMNKKDLAAKLTRIGLPEGPFNMNLKKNQKSKIDIFKLPVVFYTSGFLYVGHYISILFQTLFFALIFSFIFGFTGRRNLRDMPWNRLFAIVIYASFPAIIVASFFPALDLPIDYQTVFLFCYVCYLMVALMRVERAIDAETEG